MKKLLLIVNPCSGKRKTARFLSQIIDIFNRAGYDVSIYITAARTEATAVAAGRAKDFDMIVCAGGDGTFNEVVSGMVSGGATCPLGYIPAGSTNDFASSLGLSSNILQAAKDIIDGTEKTFDIGKFGNRYFSYVASFGAFTRASYATSQSVKNALGHLAYVLGGIKEIPSIHGYDVKFETDKGEVFEDSYIFGAISNSTSVGGVLTLSETMVDLDDGLFELLLIRKPKNAAELGKCVTALLRQNYDSPMITFCPTRKVEITADPEMSWTLDGEEEYGHEVVTAENLHDAIRVIVPKPKEKRIRKKRKCLLKAQ
ncbi:MAG: YegS/Rv2252/BmrU family lipid kinase [Clostridia bacterium]|nr:YegS/Rv2252/BmrU family lipid kinase [Clostridia bacterium]